MVFSSCRNAFCVPSFLMTYSFGVEIQRIFIRNHCPIFVDEIPKTSSELCVENVVLYQRVNCGVEQCFHNMPCLFGFVQGIKFGFKINPDVLDCHVFVVMSIVHAEFGF